MVGLEPKGGCPIRNISFDPNSLYLAHSPQVEKMLRNLDKPFLFRRLTVLYMKMQGVLLDRSKERIE